MSTLITKANWNIAKGKLKQRFAKLMHDDVQFFEGTVDELVGRIQQRARMGVDDMKSGPPEGRESNYKHQQ